MLLYKDKVMTLQREITRIPARYMPPLRRYKRVAVYCRVSTHHAAQEDSLKSQTERFQRLVDSKINWKLVKIYSDVASGRNTTGRTEFANMMNDCRARKIDLIVTKSISRFGRNTVDILSNIRELKKYDVNVYFEVENIYTLDSTSEFMLSVVGVIAQEDSASKGANIRMGIRYKMENGTSALYSRPCYGYRKGEDGGLAIDAKQAKNVRWIFDLYSQGHSVVSIMRELRKRRIKSPSGKDVWSKRAVEALLTNEKYVGDVIVGKTFKGEFPSNKRHYNRGEHKVYQMKNAHEPIIRREIFEQAQHERKLRSNIEAHGGKIVRKNTKYSMKNASQTGSTK